MNYTTGEAVQHLRKKCGLKIPQLAAILNISNGTLQKIEHDQRELSFLVALRLLDYMGLAVDEFAALLSADEIGRTELSTIRYWEKHKKGTPEKK